MHLPTSPDDSMRRTNERSTKNVPVKRRSWRCFRDAYHPLHLERICLARRQGLTLIHLSAQLER